MRNNYTTAGQSKLWDSLFGWPPNTWGTTSAPDPFDHEDDWRDGRWAKAAKHKRVASRTVASRPLDPRVNHGRLYVSEPPADAPPEAHPLSTIYGRP